MALFSQLGEALARALGGEDDDMRLIREAAEGTPVDYEKLGEAYWRKHQSTYRPPDVWWVMSRAQRDAVYRTRHQLAALFARLSRDQQEWIRDMEPPRPDDWRGRGRRRPPAGAVARAHTSMGRVDRRLEARPDSWRLPPDAWEEA